MLAKKTDLHVYLNIYNYIYEEKSFCLCADRKALLRFNYAVSSLMKTLILSSRHWL